MPNSVRRNNGEKEVATSEIEDAEQATSNDGCQRPCVQADSEEMAGTEILLAASAWERDLTEEGIEPNPGPKGGTAQGYRKIITVLCDALAAHARRITALEAALAKSEQSTASVIDVPRTPPGEEAPATPPRPTRSRRRRAKRETWCVAQEAPTGGTYEFFDYEALELPTLPLFASPDLAERFDLTADDSEEADKEQAPVADLDAAIDQCARCAGTGKGLFGVCIECKPLAFEMPIHGSNRVTTAPCQLCNGEGATLEKGHCGLCAGTGLATPPDELPAWAPPHWKPEQFRGVPASWTSSRDSRDRIRRRAEGLRNRRGGNPERAWVVWKWDVPNAPDIVRPLPDPGGPECPQH